uniref:NADH-ubiquinone oxidoreductase chain 1 n=1 Tax=Aeolothrips indicus TaxID=2856552 RepID=A0A8F5J8D1_9NEOP|nr:NADH dehydrogenase subunit 1 [Aeolothrips indicus]
MPFMVIIMTSLMMSITILISVAFLTLMERKILGSIQIRLGPNKVGAEGILQPFSDAIKLYSKESNMPTLSNMKIFFLAPVMGLLISLSCWIIMPYLKVHFSANMGMILYMSVMGLSIYILLMAGWSSNSTYATLGAMRCIAQTISYEVTLIFIIMSMFILNETLNFYTFLNHQKYIWFIFLTPIFFMWMIVTLAELNRTPFDFGEGESELVSGFNVEYSGVGFALIFMNEYAMIILASFMTTLLFLGSDIYSFTFYLKVTMVAFSIIWTRGCLPRFRYDKLMYLTWKNLLPCSLNLVTLNFCLSLIL